MGARGLRAALIVVAAWAGVTGRPLPLLPAGLRLAAAQVLAERLGKAPRFVVVGFGHQAKI